MMRSATEEDQLSPDVTVPGYVYHIPYPQIPVPPEDLRRFRAFLNGLLEELRKTRPLQALYLVHPLQIPPDIWREQNRKYAICWEWESGQAVQLSDRPAGRSVPKPASQRFIEDLAKAFPDQLGKLPASAGQPRNTDAEIVHLLRESEDFARMFSRRRWFSPLEVFLGSGGCTLYLVENVASFFKLGKALTIAKADPGLGGLDFAVPVFTLAQFNNASPETLETWFQLFEVYISENRADAGVIIASRHDIGAVIERNQEILTRAEEATSPQPET